MTRTTLFSRRPGCLRVTNLHVAPLAVGAVAALALAGCGSSSTHNKPKTSNKTKSAGIKVTPTKLPATASRAGATSLRTAGLKKLVKAQRVAVTAHLGGLGQMSISDAIQTVAGDLSSFWSQEFASSGVTWPQMQDALVDQSAVQTECSARPTVTPTSPYYLCDGSSGGTFYWTVPWMKQNLDTDAGGVNLAFDMADLWSVHILNLAGATNDLQKGTESAGDYAEQAVCLTGVYAYSLNQRNLFQQGDAQTVQNFLTSLSGIPGVTSGSVSGVSNQQLQDAFKAGANSGSPSTCGIKAGSGASGASGTSGTSSTSGATGTNTSGTSGSIPVG